VRRKNEFRRPLALLGYSMGGVHVVRLLANEPRIADAQEDELLEQLEPHDASAHISIANAIKQVFEKLVRPKRIDNN